MQVNGGGAMMFLAGLLLGACFGAALQALIQAAAAADARYEAEDLRENDYDKP